MSRPSAGWPLGEVTDREFTNTPVSYGMAALGGLIAVFLLVASPFMWNGWISGTMPIKKVVVEALRQGRLELIVSLDLSMETTGIERQPPGCKPESDRS